MINEPVAGRLTQSDVDAVIKWLLGINHGTAAFDEDMAGKAIILIRTAYGKE